MKITLDEAEKQLTQRRLDCETLILNIKQLQSEINALRRSSDDNGTGSVDWSDITNKPTIPAAQVNSDWNATSGVAEILNKPIIPPDTPGYIPNTLLSGGLVAWISGYTFQVSAATYVINNTTYNSAEDTITLDAADATNDRIDVIAVNVSGAVEIIKGTASSNPERPDVDPATQLMITFVIVTADTTEPSVVSNEIIYQENTEWTSSVSGGFNAASTNNPHAGSKDIEATNAANGNYVQLQRGSTLDLSSFSNLIFYIRSKGVFPRQKQISITFRNAGVQVGNAVSLVNGNFSFNDTNTTTYQQIIIPLNLFGAGVINQIRFQVSGGGANVGFYLDDIILQTGLNPPPPTTEEITSVVGFIINDGSTGTNVGPGLIAPRDTYFKRCMVYVKESDPSVAFTFMLKASGVNIFSTSNTISAGALTGLVMFTNLTVVPYLCSLNTIFTIDVSSGNENWKLTIQLE